jgi:restriction endonuclease S subunit
MKFIITESQFERLVENQKYVDSLLDKISEEGYQSLSIDEKRYLDEFSRHEGDPDEFVDPQDRHDEREGMEIEGEISGLPIKYTFSEESDNTEGIGYYGGVEFDGDEYLGVVISDERGHLVGYDFYSVLSDEDVRLQDKLEGLEHEVSLFFSDEVIPSLKN